MKKLFKILLLTLICFSFINISKVEASSDLTLKNLNFDAKLNKDGSINVTETWNITISDTNTLFKTFNYGYTTYTDVKVAEIRE